MNVRSLPPEVTVGLGALLVYLLLMFWVAAVYIRRANRRWLHAHQAAFRARYNGQARNSKAIDQLVPPAVTEKRLWRRLLNGCSDVLSSLAYTAPSGSSSAMSLPASPEATTRSPSTRTCSKLPRSDRSTPVSTNPRNPRSGAD